MMNAAQELRSVRQLAEELRVTGGFSETSLRWLIYNASANGFDACVVRLGRKVFIDRQRFGKWIEAQRPAKRSQQSARRRAR